MTPSEKRDAHETTRTTRSTRAAAATPASPRPTGNETPKNLATRRLSPTRLETFADGVFAIAATLLILNVDAQIPGDVARSRRAAPAHLAVVPRLCGQLRHDRDHVGQPPHGDDADRPHRPPLPVRQHRPADVHRLLAVPDSPGGRAHPRRVAPRDAALVYGFTMVATAIMFNITWFYAAPASRLLRPDADPAVVSGITRSLPARPWIYLGATLLAFAQPGRERDRCSWLIAPLYVVESSIFGNVDLERREQRVDDPRVELRAAALPQLARPPRPGQRLAVRAVARHRVVGVAAGDDPGQQRDLLAGEPVRDSPRRPSARGTSGRRGRSRRAGRRRAAAAARPRSCGAPSPRAPRSSSGPGLLMIEFGTRTLPTSCSSAANSASRRSRAPTARAGRRPAASARRRRGCASPVYSSSASTTSPSRKAVPR